MRKMQQKKKTKGHFGLFEEAKKYLAGGVNSPVRSFRSVGGDPVFVEKAKGSKIFSADGREFVDYCQSWGAMILGHAHPKVVKAIQQAVTRGTSYGMPTALETELAGLVIEAFPSIERVRLTSSGTEAVMSAVRLARGFTGRTKIIKFEGSYHGHADHLLVKAGSGAATLGIPDSLGVPEDFTRHTIVLPYNDLNAIRKTFERSPKEIAAILVEPVSGNMGVVPPAEGFLKGLRGLCDAYGAVLIFDEVITGFRISYGGAQEYFGVKPDMTCLGKILGGGMPMGAFGGREEIMKMVAPLGGVYQAGTLSGNPVAVTAGITTLRILKAEKPYKRLAETAKDLCAALAKNAATAGIPVRINQIASMFTVFFTSNAVTDYQTAASQDVPLFRKFYHALLDQGTYFAPSCFEANFLSTVHSEKDLCTTLRSARAAFQTTRGRQTPGF